MGPVVPVGRSESLAGAVGVLTTGEKRGIRTKSTRIERKTVGNMPETRIAGKSRRTVFHRRAVLSAWPSRAPA